jgi:hypothetical protein
MAESTLKKAKRRRREGEKFSLSPLLSFSFSTSTASNSSDCQSKQRGLANRISPDNPPIRVSR